MRYRVVDPLEDEDDVKPLGEEAEEVEVLPRVPDHSMSEDEVARLPIEYSIRAADDFVISGPLGDGGGPGRRFSTIAAAMIWATRKYGGKRIKQRIAEAESGGRWAFLIAAQKAGE